MTGVGKMIFAGALAAGLMTGAAQADTFGAIAFSQNTGAHGYSYNFPSRARAERHALGNCRNYAGDCAIATWFVNSCGAIAVGRGNGWGVGWGEGRAGVQRRAMAECRARTSGCQVVRWVCSGG
jgi:hypothetical protein